MPNGRKRKRRHMSKSTKCETVTSPPCKKTVSEAIGEANRTLDLLNETFTAMDEHLNSENFPSNGIEAPPAHPPAWLGDLLKNVDEIKDKIQKLDTIEKNMRAVILRVEKVETGLDEVKGRVSQIEDSCSFINKQYEDHKKNTDSVVSKVQAVKKDVQKAIENHKELKEEVGRISKGTAHTSKKSNYKFLDMEARSRRQNLLFHGMHEERGEDCYRKISAFIHDELGVGDGQISINRAHRIGPSRDDKIRPIIASFVNDQQKEDVLARSKQRERGAKVYLTRDYPRAISEARKDLSQKLMDVRKNGRRGHIAFPAKLVVEGKVVDDRFPDWNENTRQSYAEVTKESTEFDPTHR